MDSFSHIARQASARRASLDSSSFQRDQQQPDSRFSTNGTTSCPSSVQMPPRRFSTFAGSTLGTQHIQPLSRQNISFSSKRDFEPKSTEPLGFSKDDSSKSLESFGAVNMQRAESNPVAPGNGGGFGQGFGVGRPSIFGRIRSKIEDYAERHRQTGGVYGHDLRSLVGDDYDKQYSASSQHVQKPHAASFDFSQIRRHSTATTDNGSINSEPVSSSS